MSGMIDDILNEMDSLHNTERRNPTNNDEFTVKDRGGWNGLHQDMINRHADRINNILYTTEDDQEFISIYFKILEYFAPKVTREMKKQSGKDSGETKLTVHKTVKIVNQET
jgi:ankyrin repeat protein